VFLGILPIQCKTGAIDLLAIPGIDSTEVCFISGDHQHDVPIFYCCAV